MSEPAPPSSKLRWLLLSVSAFLLALLLVSGFLAVRFLSEMHTQELAVTRALAERTQSLSGLWLSIQDYNQAMQQFVAQTAAEQDAAARRLDRLTLEIDADFERYPSVRDSEEDALLNGMRRVFSHQRTLYVAILSAGPEERRRQAGSMLTEHIVPAPKQILEWSGKLQAWNGERLQQADRALVSQFANLHGRLSQALAIGFRERPAAGAGKHGVHRQARSADPRPLRGTRAKPAGAATAFGAPGGHTGDRTPGHLPRVA